MPIYIYNSLTKQKEEFKPLNPGMVKIYACGVTVYDESHLGHLRAALVFEVIRRYFIYKGYEVKFVRNVTDVDDKIIDKARKELKGASFNETDLKNKVRDVAERYLLSYYEDTEVLGISRADIEPKATEHIHDMLNLIKVLIDKGYAYQADGDVYFEVRKFAEYGKLSKQSLDQMQAGARVEIDERKKDPLDFALWKKAKEGEPFWQSPWGNGRPGWHIECSAMSMKYLGEQFDVHGGGRDLIFPHHENEIAQSEAYTGKKFANYWLHNGLLTINGEKMAKSKGNFITIKEVMKRYHPDELKILFLSTHYAHPIDFSYERMDEANKARERFTLLLEKIEQFNLKAASEPARPEIKDELIRVEARSQAIKKTEEFYGVIDRSRKKFEDAMDDDFNTAGALAALFDLAGYTNRFILEENIPVEQKVRILNCAKFALMELGRVLVLFIQPQEKSKEPDPNAVDSLVKLLISVREEARKKKDFTTSDTIRNKLSALGFTLEDTKEGTVYRYKKG